jgi:hypothetical protein
MSEASTVQGTAWPILVHSLRTAIACVASLLVCIARTKGIVRRGGWTLGPGEQPG